MSKKRGRKLKDEIDYEMDNKRKTVRRGVNSIPSLLDDNDVTIWKILNTEIEIIRKNCLNEIKETVATEPPITVRLPITQLAVSNVVEVVKKQVEFVNQEDSGVSFTNECHIALSKACELMLIEITSRSFFEYANCKDSQITESHLVDGIRSAWGSSSDYQFKNCFDFLKDVLDHYKQHPYDHILGIQD